MLKKINQVGKQKVDVVQVNGIRYQGCMGCLNVLIFAYQGANQRMNQNQKWQKKTVLLLLS